MLSDKPLEHMIDEMLDLEADCGPADSPELVNYQARKRESERESALELESGNEQENVQEALQEQVFISEPEISSVTEEAQNEPFDLALQADSEGTFDLPEPSGSEEEIESQCQQILNEQNNVRVESARVENTQVKNARLEEEQTIMSDNSVEVVFNGECTIYEVAEWQNKIIQKWSDHHLDIVLNMSEISDVDASFVQLLLSCKKTAHAHGSQCHITQIPSVLEERLKHMHVAEILSDAC